MIKNISDFNKFDNVIITNDNIEKIRKKLDIKSHLQGYSMNVFLYLKKVIVITIYTIVK